MLHRLFSTRSASRPNPEDDHRTHHLLHGLNTCASRNHGRCPAASANDPIGERHLSQSPSPIDVGDLRVVIAQDLGDKTKVVLFDSHRKTASTQTSAPTARSKDSFEARTFGSSLSSEHTTTPRRASTISRLDSNGGSAQSPNATPRIRRDSPGSPSLSNPKPTETGGAANTNTASSEMLAELMFGTAPLSYKGTSVRVHPLPNDGSDRRLFLFTKAFSVSVTQDLDGAQSPMTANSSGQNSLSSSYSNGSAMQEFPFPRLTPVGSTGVSHASLAMTSTLTGKSSGGRQHHHHRGESKHAHSHSQSHSQSSSAGKQAHHHHHHLHQQHHQQHHQQQHHHSHLPDPAVLTPFEGSMPRMQPRQPSGMHHRRVASGSQPSIGSSQQPRHHARQPSVGGEDRSSAPHVPFNPEVIGAENNDYFSGWLPSPEPKFATRGGRASFETNRSPTPSHSYSRYQSSQIAIGVVFAIPGTGLEEAECAVLTRYWQMIARATFGLQRVVYDEAEPALNFVAAHGTVPTPRSARSSARPVKGEAQVYQRGKKYYVALAQHSLSSSSSLLKAVNDFRDRLVGGISLPSIVQLPLQTEAELLVDEVTYLMQVLDCKERNFLLSTSLSYLANHRDLLQSHSDAPDARNSLSSRIVVVSDDAVLARRFLYCVARLFFRRHNEHLRNLRDYSLVWPAAGILAQDRRDLMRRRESTLRQHAAAVKTVGWDIPGNHAAPQKASRLPSSGDLSSMPMSSLQSPSSIYLRPPSSASTTSSRTSSWRPSWSWFGGSSGGNSHGTGLRDGRKSLDSSGGSIRSESRTMQTSWTSSEFADVPVPPLLNSPRSPLRNNSQELLVPTLSSEDSEQDDPEEAPTPPEQLKAIKQSDGSVLVQLLPTSALFTKPTSRRRSSARSSSQPQSPERDVSAPSAMLNHTAAFHEFPLTGYLTRFHPDMLMQGVPASTWDERVLHDYLVEEDLHVHRPARLREAIRKAHETGAGENSADSSQPTTPESDNAPGRGITDQGDDHGVSALVIELGPHWRIRRLTRRADHTLEESIAQLSVRADAGEHYSAQQQQSASEALAAAAAALSGESPMSVPQLHKPKPRAHQAPSTLTPHATPSTPSTATAMLASLAHGRPTISRSHSPASVSSAGSMARKRTPPGWLSPPPTAVGGAGGMPTDGSIVRRGSPLARAGSIHDVDETFDTATANAIWDPEHWHEHLVTEIDDNLLQRLLATMQAYRKTRKLEHVERLVGLFD
ncbi:hypothetical protein PYCC9005_003606 [Savitreella phatthalungensis]